jgi:hypothetical protein
MLRTHVLQDLVAIAALYEVEQQLRDDGRPNNPCNPLQICEAVY